jgi:L-ascorbate metabolism protein UlaG (beta-lactamase superfamily)
VAAQHDAEVVAIYELATWVSKKGVKKIIGMNLGGTVQLADVAATMVEAKHSSAAQDEHGDHYVGVAAGFVLTIKNGPVIYHAGDTSVFGDMQLIQELYHPTVAILPIGGHFTMGPHEAALAVRYLQPRSVLPIHFGTTPQLRGTPLELAAQIPAEVEVVRWSPGETITRG